MQQIKSIWNNLDSILPLLYYYMSKKVSFCRIFYTFAHKDRIPTMNTPAFNFTGKHPHPHDGTGKVNTATSSVSPSLCSSCDRSSSSGSSISSPPSSCHSLFTCCAAPSSTCINCYMENLPVLVNGGVPHLQIMMNVQLIIDVIVFEKVLVCSFHAFQSHSNSSKNLAALFEKTSFTRYLMQQDCRR